MTRGLKIWIAALAALSLAGGAAFWVWRNRPQAPVPTQITLGGVVLRQDTDPRKQSPLAGVDVLITGGVSTGEAKTDATGTFSLTLRPGLLPGETVTLKMTEPDYAPLTISSVSPHQLFLARMSPLRPEVPLKATGKETVIKDVRVRYTVKTTTTVNVSSAAQTFEIENKANVPCRGQTPCSPDGKWKANLGTIALDAGDRNEFRSTRVSCIAGPCPFSKIQSDNVDNPGRKIDVKVLNWSDTVTYLIEAEVARTLEADMVRQSYPVVLGGSMNFTLPSSAQGPSILAGLDGTEIVFPLGPALILSWAGCTVEDNGTHNKLYQCQLKPGYRFQ